MKKQNGITLIALVISIIVMLILAGVSINAVIGDNGVIGKAQETLYLQSCAVLEEFLQMEASNYALEENPYGTQHGLLKAKHPGWFYQNAQGYILDSDGHVLYLIRKAGLPQEIQDQLTGGDANKVSQYYKQVDVYGVTSDLQAYYCNNGTDTILGLTIEDLEKDDPLEIAYDEESLLSKVVNGTNEEGKANEALSTQDLKSIKTLTIDSTEKLALLNEFIKLPTLQTVYFSGITIPNLNGIQNAPSIIEVRFTSCTVNDYSALCGLTKLNRLYLIQPVGKNVDVATLCSSDKGIATAEFSNLQYFGIVGSGTYIQSTDMNYSTARYDITDVSGLANLSKTTKEAIKYMYLQNLQLTSIASIVDFINVTILRVEQNALTTFEGIQNMSKLQYLIAPSLYSNSTSSYTLGINETSTLNNNTDALSYIYKNEEGNNTSLSCLNLTNSRNLKWVNYLSTCIKLNVLYLDSSTSIKDISTIANVLGNCGINYKLPSTYTPSIIANNSVKLDLTSQTITETQFRTLKNNTNLAYLCLDKTNITSDSNTTLTDDEYTSLINEVLSTCINMKDLSLGYQTKLKNIEFIQKMPKIIALNLYNCSQISDLTILETETNEGNLNLGFLCLNNENIDLATIQNTISNLGKSGTETWHSTGTTGLWVGNEILASKLSTCTEITYLRMYRYFDSDGYMPTLTTTIDLSNCTKLETINMYNCRLVIKAPASLKSFANGYSKCAKADLSNCNNLEYFSFTSDYTPQTLVDTIMSLPDNLTTVKEIYLRNCGTYENWEFLSKFVNCENLEKFSFSQCHANSNVNYKDLTGLRYLTYVREILVSYNSNNVNSFTLPPLENLVNLKTITFMNSHCNDISNVSTYIQVESLSITGTNIRNTNALSNLTNLKTLDLSYNKLTDIYGLSNLTNLTSLAINNNNINDIKPLENLKKLEGLNLQYNAVYDNSYDKNGKSYYTLTVLADLNQNQDGSLKRLYLKGNSIDDFSMLQDSNLQWDDKSGW